MGSLHRNFLTCTCKHSLGSTKLPRTNERLRATGVQLLIGNRKLRQECTVLSYEHSPMFRDHKPSRQQTLNQKAQLRTCQGVPPRRSWHRIENRLDSSLSAAISWQRAIATQPGHPGCRSRARRRLRRRPGATRRGNAPARASSPGAPSRPPELPPPARAWSLPIRLVLMHLLWLGLLWLRLVWLHLLWPRSPLAPSSSLPASPDQVNRSF